MLMESNNVRIMVKCINYLNSDEFGFNFEGFMEFNQMFFIYIFYIYIYM